MSESPFLYLGCGVTSDVMTSDIGSNEGYDECLLVVYCLVRCVILALRCVTGLRVSDNINGATK